MLRPRRPAGRFRALILRSNLAFMTEPIVIVGSGGLGREVLAALHASGEWVGGFVVDPGYPSGTIAGLPVRNDPEAWSGAGPFVVAIGDAQRRWTTAADQG
jgi:hypothetical protein